MRSGWLALALLVAGCAAPSIQPAPGSWTVPPSSSAAPSAEPIGCVVVDAQAKPVPGAACHYHFGTLDRDVTVGPAGNATLQVRIGTHGTLEGHAAGYEPKEVALVADRPQSVRMELSASPAPGTSAPPPNGTNDFATTTDAPVPTPPAQARQWLVPHVVEASAVSGLEPQIAIAPDGTIYYVPADSIFRSRDGVSFQNISPGLPNLGSDDTVSVAPDGSVWWADYWGYLGTDQACTSTNRGDSWTCDYVAHPGANDRMWIVGLSVTEGYLQTGEALTVPQWEHTITGSLKYVPYAQGISPLVGQLGSMTYDSVHKAVWQMGESSPQSILRIDGQVGVIGSSSTGFPGTYALPGITAYNGTLWTTSESGGAVSAARSSDGGVTWQVMQVSQGTPEAIFSAVAAGPNGRAAVVYLGSDKAGTHQPNGGTWSLYVAETNDAMDPSPTWVETKVVDDVHKGDLCTGINCQQSGSDPNARVEGDIIGIAIDPKGNAHAAYVQDQGGSFAEMEVHQFVS
ncbi:MAG: hypothetical protein ACYDBQ_09475 [Thermoplasmatota archaeon]